MVKKKTVAKSTVSKQKKVKKTKVKSSSKGKSQTKNKSKIKKKTLAKKSIVKKNLKKPLVSKVKKSELKKLEVLDKIKKLDGKDLEDQLLKDENTKIPLNVKAEQTLKKEEKKELPPKQKIKSFFGYFFAVILLLFFIGGILLISGIKDFSKDKTYFIVVNDDDEALAGSLYNIINKTFQPVNLKGFPSVEDSEKFHEYAKNTTKINIDKVIIINYNSLEKISSLSMEYNGMQISADEMTRYFSNVRQLPNELRKTKENDRIIKSKILGAWITSYHQNLWSGEEDYKPFLVEYRRGNIIVTPMNGALFMMKIGPFEKLVMRYLND